MDFATENLIDFNVEESDTVQECDIKTTTVNSIALIPSPRLSLDNNPFDYIQKLSICRTDDPFDIVEKEASLKARQIQSQSSDVKIGKLLSLSEDSEIADSKVFDSNAFHTAEENYLENESPPVTVSTKWSPFSSTADSGGTAASCDSSDSNKEQACSTRARQTRNHRNRLLKLSISNAVFSTPMSSRQNLDKVDSLRYNMASELISMYAETEESSIDSESPVKLIDDDLKSEEPPEIDYDADLELMKIPMLKQLHSPKEKSKDEQLVRNEKDVNFEHCNFSGVRESTALTQLPDLESIRLKLRTQRFVKNNQKDISELIKDFKNMICDSKIVDESKKQEVDNLLETLKSTLTVATSSSPEVSPKPIVRQSTFDIDLKPNDKKAEQQDLLEDGLACPHPMEDVPDVMFKSSATYDGETAEERPHLNLPQIEPPSPECEQPFEANVKDLIEQLQHMFEQQQLSSDMSNVSNAGSISTSAVNNPTFIVVMPTIAQNSLSEVSHDSGHSYNSSIRRRSQSLSLHDKLKIVHLPIKSSNTPDIKITENNESPPLNTSTFNTAESFDFKTPARFLPRRNSFSSATPLNPGRYSRLNNSIIGKSNSNGTEKTPYSCGSPIQNRRLSIHNEMQETNIVQRANLGLVKPDLKKKVRNANSILKSNGPLKATMPIKKVAPSIKTTINTPSSQRTSTSNTSMHLVAKAGHMSHTSTPMTTLRTNGLKPLNKAFPNVSNTSSNIEKSSTTSMRYSNIATTPIGKQQVSTAHLRRRTISEFKAKSPIKARTSSNIATTMNISKSKPLLSRPISSSAKNPVRPSAVDGNSYFSNKNKENNKRES